MLAHLLFILAWCSVVTIYTPLQTGMAAPSDMGNQMPPDFDEKAFLQFIEALAQEIEKEQQLQQQAASVSKSGPASARPTPRKIPTYLQAPGSVKLVPGNLRANFLASFLPPEIPTGATEEEKKTLLRLPQQQRVALTVYAKKFTNRLEALDSLLSSLSSIIRRELIARITKQAGGVPFRELLDRVLSSFKIIIAKAASRRALYDPAFVVLRDRIVYYVETLKALIEQVEIPTDPTQELSIGSLQALNKIAGIVAVDFPLLNDELLRVLSFSKKTTEEKREFRQKRYEKLRTRLAQEQRAAEQRARFEQLGRTLSRPQRDRSPWDRQQPRHSGYGGRDGYYYPGMYGYDDYPGWGGYEEAAAAPAGEKKPAPSKEEGEKKKKEKPEEKLSEKTQYYLNTVKSFDDLVREAAGTKDPKKKSDLLEQALGIKKEIENTERYLDSKQPLVKTAKTKFKKAKELLKEVRSKLPDEYKKRLADIEGGAKPGAMPSPKEEPGVPHEKPEPKPVPTPKPSLDRRVGPPPVTPIIPKTPAMFTLYNSTTKEREPILELNEQHLGQSAYYALYNALCLTLSDGRAQLTRESLDKQALFDKYGASWKQLVAAMRTNENVPVNDSNYLTSGELRALLEHVLEELAHKERAAQFIILESAHINKPLEIGADILYELADADLDSDVHRVFDAVLAGAMRATFLINGGHANVPDTQPVLPLWVTVTVEKRGTLLAYTIADATGHATSYVLSAEALCYGLHHRQSLRDRKFLLLAGDELKLQLDSLTTILASKTPSGTTLESLTKRWQDLARIVLSHSIFAVVAAQKKAISEVFAALTEALAQEDRGNVEALLPVLFNHYAELLGLIHIELLQTITEEMVRRVAYIAVLNRNERELAHTIADGLRLMMLHKKQPLISSAALTSFLVRAVTPTGGYSISLSSLSSMLNVISLAQLHATEITMGTVLQGSEATFSHAAYASIPEGLQRASSAAQRRALLVVQTIVSLITMAQQPRDEFVQHISAVAALYPHLNALYEQKVVEQAAQALEQVRAQIPAETIIDAELLLTIAMLAGGLRAMTVPALVRAEGDTEAMMATKLYDWVHGIVQSLRTGMERAGMTELLALGLRKPATGETAPASKPWWKFW